MQLLQTYCWTVCIKLVPMQLSNLVLDQNYFTGTLPAEWSMLSQVHPCFFMSLLYELAVHDGQGANDYVMISAMPDMMCNA